MTFGQVRPVSARQSFNAFQQGVRTGDALRQRQDERDVGNAFKTGGYQAAAQTAGEQGNMQLAQQLMSAVSQQNEQDRTQTLQEMDTLARIGLASEQLPAEQRMSFIQQQAAARGLDDALAIYQDPAQINATARTMLSVKDQLGQRNTDRAFTEQQRQFNRSAGQRDQQMGIAAYNADTSRMGAETSRMNAERQAEAMRAKQQGAAAPPPGTVQLNFSAEAKNRVALGLPGVISANKQLTELFEGGTRFSGTDDRGGLGIKNKRDQTATALSGVPFVGDYAQRVVGTDERDALLRASSAYESALLPILSGAAVTDSEARRTVRAAIPAPGDSDVVLQAKAELRSMHEQVMRAGLSGQPFNIDELIAATSSVEQLMQQASGSQQSEAVGFTTPSGDVIPEGTVITQNGQTFVVKGGQVVPQ